VRELGHHATICSRLMQYSAFSQLQAAVRADERLSASLVKLLHQHTLHAATAPLLLSAAARALAPGWPAEHPDDEGGQDTCWNLVRHVCRLLTSSSALRDAYQAQLSSSAEAVSALWQLVLALAEQLPPRAGQQLPDSSLAGDSWIAVSSLLRAAKTAQRAQHERQPGSAAAQAAAREGSWGLLRPAAAAQLAALARTSCNEAGLHRRAY
jgi:hypothetical protein